MSSLFNELHCTTQGYDFLQQSGIEQRILASKKDVHDALLYGPWGSDALKKTFKKTFSKATTWHEANGEKRAHLRELDLISHELDTRDDNPSDRNEAFMDYPQLLAHIVLGDDVLRYEKHGLSTRRELQEAISAYCLGERWQLGMCDKPYVWRKNDRRNEVHHDRHGDFVASQWDISGKVVNEETFFGPRRKIQMATDAPRTGIDCLYTAWPSWLVAILRYAEAVGVRDIKELQDYATTIREVGPRGTATTESQFGLGNSFGGVGILLEERLLRSDDADKGCFLELPVNHADYRIVPYLEGTQLRVALSDKEGTVTFPRVETLRDKRFTVQLTYDPSDIPDLLRATYRDYGRERESLPFILESSKRGWSTAPPFSITAG